MKKNFLTSAVLSLLVFSTPVFAQDNQAQNSSNATVTGDKDPVPAEGDLTNVINDYITAHSDILNPQKCQYFVGVAAITVPAGKKGHANSRVIAYHKAFLMARQEFGKWLQTEVTSSMQNMSSEGHGLGKAESEVQQSINNALMDSLKKQAKSKGIDVEDKAAFAKFVKENVVGSENFQQQIAAAGNVFQQGLMAYKTFANGTQVGVIAVYNERNLSAAKALRSGEDNSLRGKAKRALRSQIPTDPKILACTFGSRILRNENGEYCIVGYGHVVASSKSQRSKIAASQKAALQAINEIKEFSGEQIVFSESQELAEAGGELSDGTVTGENSEKFERSVKQKASTLKINGARPIFSSTINLPSGETIVVMATAWVPGDAIKAKKTARDMQIGKDEKNRGFSAQSSSTREQVSPTSQRVLPTTLKNAPTVGNSDEADLD